MFGEGWSALFWCNHGQPWIVSRLGNDQQYRIESAKMLATSLHMMQGTPYIYQGEEIVMTNPGYTSVGQYRDLESLNMYDIMLNHQGKSEQQVLVLLLRNGEIICARPFSETVSRMPVLAKECPGLMWQKITSRLMSSRRLAIKIRFFIITSA
jgi:glycosidase